MLRVLVRAAQRHSTLVEQQCGVSGAQLWAMQEVYEKPGLRVGEVAERMAIHQTTASNLIDSLVKKQCIDKLRDPEDLRAVKLVLTRHGRQILKCAPDAQRGLLPDALSKLTEEQMRDLTKGLQALTEAAGGGDKSASLEPFSFML